jgi:hypothetical protein
MNLLATTQQAEIGLGSQLIAPRHRLLEINAEKFRSGFGSAPFLIGHYLAEHPLFEFGRLLDLARKLPKNSVEYHASNIAAGHDWHMMRQNGLSPEETIRHIEQCKSWMILKYVEQDPNYRRVLHSCLSELEEFGHPYARGISKREGFIFISSPGSVTPYHMDPECNFLLQIRGKKQVSIFDGNDRSIVSEQELEQFYTDAPRGLVFKDEYQPKASVFEMGPGDGLHLPVTWPHWVKVHNEVSVSFGITFQTRATERRDVLYTVNHYLRKRGFTPTPVGASWLRDTVKLNTYRVYQRLHHLMPGKPSKKTRM